MGLLIESDLNYVKGSVGMIDGESGCLDGNVGV